MKNFLLYSKKISYVIHFSAIFYIIWFLFPSLFTTRDIPNWPILGNFTLRGVDSNNNDIRDDIEIRLHRRITDSDLNYKNILEYAKIEESQIYNPIRDKKDYYTYLKQAHCIDMNYSMLSRYDLVSADMKPRQTFEDIIFNTTERKQKRSKYVILPGREINHNDETRCGSSFDLSTYEGLFPLPEEDFERYMIKPKQK